MPTIVHLLLALVLTVFLAAQASSLVFVLRSRRAVSTRRTRRSTDLLWTCIPVLLVLFLAARSWVAVVDVHRPAVAATGTSIPSIPSSGGGPALEESTRRHD